MAGAIVTVPPYAPFIREVARHPLVKGIRLNTVMPTKEPLEALLGRLREEAEGKDVFVDLKARQLRVQGYWVPPFTQIELSHQISVDTPVTAYFRDASATVGAVDGNKLIMVDGPKRMLGPGESVNIVSPSLRIEGYLTDLDKQYLEAGAKIGLTTYMLSFVEGQEDIDAFKAYMPLARPIAKIESQRGISYVRTAYAKDSQLMAARGDLFMEVDRPHEIISALETILKADPDAIVASRLFDGLAYSPEPNMADIGDADNLLRMGYRTFMLGDEICQHRESLLGALNLLSALGEKYGGLT